MTLLEDTCGLQDIAKSNQVSFEPIYIDYKTRSDEHGFAKRAKSPIDSTRWML